MQVVRAFFDGHKIKPIEPIKTKKTTEVLVIFPNDVERFSPEEARRLLRGAGKGERLTERLLKSREENTPLHPSQEGKGEGIFSGQIFLQSVRGIYEDRI